VLKETEKQKAYSASDLAEVRKFLEAPVKWSLAHGGGDGTKKEA
jgi:hypothetical protein